jgi:thioester reductase-like protein
MAIFLTGLTGYLGSYLTAHFLRAGQDVTALVRATDPDAARVRIWKSLQLHLGPEEVASALSEGRLRFVRGDLRQARFGLGATPYQRLVDEHDTVVHAAASLNRRSSRVCFDVNLRGGLTVIQLAQAIQARGGLRRYGHVSTVAIAGQRSRQVVGEDEALDWDRSDYDPYARTKKFGEHLVDELLGPDASVVIGRPSIVLGDSRFPETTQFEMVRAFVGLGRMPVLPFDPELRLDIVPADFVAEAFAKLVLAEAPAHRRYHLAAGESAPTFREVTDALAEAGQGRKPLYLPRLGGPAARALKAASNFRQVPALSKGAALLDVFWPYLEWDVVFDNSRVVNETGVRPARFPDYCAGLYRFARESGFRYPYLPLPACVGDLDTGDWVSGGSTGRAGCGRGGASEPASAAKSARALPLAGGGA